MKLPRSGELFEGRYSIIKRLGEGGFARVYQAKDPAERLVALKVLKPDRDGYTHDVYSRFLREVKILASLRDPHTVRLFDHGQSADGLLFMVFEHIPGRDLEEVLREVGRLEPALTIRLLRQLGEALREAHSSGLLHRDLKPSNVRIYEYAGDPWRVKLLDFGIARAMLDGEKNITKTGELVGTPRYMSPEQLMGTQLSPTSDIYSLGLLALEMLLGSEVLGENSWGAQLDRLQTGHMVSIPQTSPVGASLIAVVQRMSARAPEDRLQSIDAVLTALDAVERGEYVPPLRRQVDASTSNPMLPLSAASRSDQTIPVTASQSVEIARSQRSTRLVAVAAGLVVLVVAVGYVTLRAMEPPPPPPPEPKRRHVAEVPFVAGAQSDPVTTAAHADLGASEENVDLGPVDGGSGGCGNHVAPRGRRPLRALGIEHEGQFVVPPGYDPRKPYPLVIVFHEDMQSTDMFLNQTQLDIEAEKRGYVLVAPLGAVNDLPWRNRAHVRHIKGMVDQVAERLCIDEERIFIVGHGSGGTAAHFLSCDGWAAAVATVSYRPGVAELRRHCASPPIRHLQFHALKSHRMPLNGGTHMPCAPSPKVSLDDFEQHWRVRNKCSKRGKPYRVEELGTCLSYVCEEPLVSCRLNGGHGFPGGTRESPINAMICEDIVPEFPAREMIYDFFDEHPDQ